MRLDRITKIFSATRAVSAVSLDLAPSEVHGLIGENGAGKSTLMRVLAGFYPDYEGQIIIGGRPVRLVSPADARAYGVRLVHQELSLLPELTVAENILLGSEPRARVPVFIDRRKTSRYARDYLSACGVEIDPNVPVSRLRVAERQLVEIVKGVATGPRVLILDEPTSSLSRREVTELFRTIETLRRQQTAIVYISHKLGEIFEVCQRITVLRDGVKVAGAPTAEWTEPRLVHSMVGRDLSALFPRNFRPPGPVRLEVADLARRGAFGGMSFSIRCGEIVGLYGIVGAGRTALAEALFGLQPAHAGTIHLDGRAVRIRSPAGALRAGIAMVTEDRRVSGLVPMLSVKENLSLGALWKVSRFGIVNRRMERAEVNHFLRALLIRAASPLQEVTGLSGGNQQKVVVGRSLMSEPKVLILDEPTRGIDVVAKAELHASIDRLAEQGLAVLMISSELPEILGMCDRILVMRAGQLVGSLDRAGATEQQLVAMAAGASHAE